jgi:hypothetical protein
VIISLIFVGGGLVALLLAAVAYLTARGIDPAPMVTTVGVLVAAAGTLGNLVLQLASRSTTTKVERNTGVLASAVYDVADAMPRPVAAPPRPRHGYPDTGNIEAPPAPRGSEKPA